MNCLQKLPSSYLVPMQVGGADPRRGRPPSFVVGLVPVLGANADPRSRAIVAMDVSSGSIPNSKSEKNGAEADGQNSDAEADEKKSEIYSHNMTQAMGAVLTYRHELGMNYDFIIPDLIVGSCVQTPADVDKLRKIGVKTIFCLQQDPDLAYFDVDIKSIQEYAKKCQDIKHYRSEIRDFDAFDLRMRLPTVVSELHNAIEQNGGITYIHCTAGLGRAPAVVLAYMFWVRGHGLAEAHDLLLSKRPCFPKLEAIKSATADIITGLSKNTIRFMWDGRDCSSVEVSGLDIGWGQRIPMIFDEVVGAWILERELPLLRPRRDKLAPKAVKCIFLGYSRTQKGYQCFDSVGGRHYEGRHEYKYIVDGKWTCNESEMLTEPNSDGHVNNYVHVLCDGTDVQTRLLRDRLMSKDINLSPKERKAIRDYFEFYKRD